MQRPFIPLTIALIFGITLGYYVDLPDTFLLVCLMITFVSLLLGIIKKRNRLILPVLLAAVFFIGNLNINVYLHPKTGSGHIKQYADKEAVIMEGIISESPQTSPDKMELIISDANIVNNGVAFPVEGRAIITVKGYSPFRYGDFIRFAVNLKTPHNFQNPGGFDYEKYLLYRRILVRGFINNADSIVIVRQNQGNPIKAFIEDFRMKLKGIIYENAESPQREIVQAMILGDQKEIAKDVMEKFNRTGVSHIIAISGFNVGIIAFFSLFIVRLIMKSSEIFLLKFNMITASTLFSLIPVVIFCLIAGLGISVVRATIMAVVFMAAILIGKERDLYNTLALAAFIILIIAPYSLFDVSFQLSFAAVGALLFITPRLSRLVSAAWSEEKREQHPRLFKILINSALFVIVTAGATLGTLPLIIFYFNRFSTIVLPANIAVVPILGIIAIPVSMIIILTAPISATLSLPFIYVSSKLAELALKIVDFFDSIPGASVIVTTPTLLEIAAYYFLLYGLVALLDKKEMQAKHENRFLLLKILCVVLSLFFIVDNFYLYAKSKTNSQISMTAIDVGQGSSALFILPYGKTMLIDGGGFSDGSFDIGKNVVAPFILYKRIKKINFVVLTHPHPDHLQGLIFILDNFAVQEVWTNGQFSNTPLYKEFLDVIKKNNVVNRVISADDKNILLDNVNFEILNPEHPLSAKKDLSEKYDLINDNSLVIRISFGKIAFLITGDIASATEANLIASGKNMRSDVLLVPHHGGSTSSTESFLRYVNPQIAIISCGKDNIYKDPHPDVLRRFGKTKATILRTDKNGAVTISTDGSKIFIEPFKAI